jgi:hypothetical protein
MPPTKAPEFIADILRQFDSLSDDAVIPVGAAAALHNLSDKTILRSYPTVRLSAGRIGVRVGDLRNIARGEKLATQ